MEIEEANSQVATGAYLRLGQRPLPLGLDRLYAFFGKLKGRSNCNRRASKTIS